MAKIAEIRMLFEAKLRDGAPEPLNSFDSRDLERVNSDKYLYRVLEHCQNNVQLAVEMLHNIMVWRKSIGANEITEETVNLDYLKEGIFFPHGRDIDSCILFIMKSKLYNKGQVNIEEVKKVIIYWLERIEREESGKKMTLFFDMDGCGLNNMDLEIIKYMVTVLKSFYPNLINYVIVFQLPWMLSAGFKIVKNLLPAAAVERLRMVNRDKLKDLVAPEQALVSWGGKDTYVFEFVPENRVNMEKTSKHVTFAETSQSLDMLRLNPGNLLIFKCEHEKISAQLTIYNREDSCISFKIRTTAPEKYLVRPSSGILSSKSSQTIQITVTSGFHLSSVEKDRFLVVSIKVPNLNVSQEELRELWKSSSTNADEHRLKCSTIDISRSGTKSGIQSQDPDSVETKLNNIQNSHNMLLKKLDKIQLYQIFTALFTFVCVIIGFYAYKMSKRYCDH